ncbi:UpaP162 family type II restriction enzyme [Mycoplasma sp. AC1221]
MNKWNLLNKYKSLLLSQLHNIFKVYKYQIQVNAEDLNLLESKNSTLRSSTAIGFIIEEFVYQKLKNVFCDFVVNIYRESNTTTQSYDFILDFSDVMFLVNIKVENNTSKNNAVASINKLLLDYYKFIKQGKNFFYLIIKIKYKTLNVKPEISYYDKIKIEDFSIYALDEFSFDNKHKQDYRNWSTNFKAESGRLIIDSEFFKNNKLNPTDSISNQKTFASLQKIFKRLKQ